MKNKDYFCCICGVIGKGFIPYRGGRSNIPEFMKLLNMVGSDVDNFSCPNCYSHDRERHLFLYLSELNLLSIFSGSNVLHFAPETHLSEIIRLKKPNAYIKADLFPSDKGIEKIDMLNIPYPDDYFDVLIANHVMEHVDDDFKALSELHRVLRGGGIAILQTPYSSRLHKTFMDLGFDDDVSRRQVYGQEDHVRVYGKDIFSHFEKAGFRSFIVTHELVLSNYSPEKYGVNREEPFFLFEAKIDRTKAIVQNNVKLPLVSVCVVTYQHRKFIRQCLEGIVSQNTNFYFEVIIGDDGSVDGTSEICQEFQRKYPELIKLTIYDRSIDRSDYGSSPGRYNGMHTLAQAKGKYIAMCEGDDYWTDTTKLQQQIDFLEQNPDFSICFHSVAVDNGNGLFKDTITTVKKSESSLFDLASGNYIHTPSVIYRNLFPERFPECFYKMAAGDYFLHLYLAQTGKIKYIDKVMAAYRVHEDSYWSSKPQLERTLLWMDALCLLVEYFSSNIMVASIFKKQLFSFGKGVVHELSLSGENEEVLQKVECILDGVEKIRIGQEAIVYAVSKLKTRFDLGKLIRQEFVANSLSPTAKNGIAVIVHLYFIDLWNEFELALAGIPQEFDLYISIHEGKTKDISSTILKKFPDAKLYEFPNKGRDIYPFLTIFKEIQPLNYKLILKLHTKKSPHLKGYKGVDDFGGKWRQTTLCSLAQWNKRVNDIFDLFDSNPDLGIFSPFGHLYPFKSTDANYQTITQLIPGVDEDAFNEKQFVYAGGSMFWFRPEAIKAVLKLDLTAENFEEESGQLDVTLAHAVERLFGVLCHTAGYILTDRMPKRDDIAYQGWLEEKREHDLSRDLLFLSDDSIKPVIHCLVYVYNEDLSLLANTIDSMGSQTYELWHLSVISSFSCPDAMFNEVSQLSWLQVEKQFDLQTLLLNVGVQSEWLGFLEAGDFLEPHALSSCVEYLNKHSEWQVVYTDEDRVSPEGFFHSPKFKAGFNLDLLYSVDYIGGLTLFKTDSLNEFG